MLDELKNDYRNPVDFCQNLNRVKLRVICELSEHSHIHMQLVLPEYGIHLGVTVMLLACGFWFTFLFNIPLLAYHMWRSIVCDTF